MPKPLAARASPPEGKNRLNAAPLTPFLPSATVYGAQFNIRRGHALWVSASIGLVLGLPQRWRAGRPAIGIAWLANKLAPWGEHLQAAEGVLAGSYHPPGGRPGGRRV